jgi:hypothetical protein
MHIDFDISPTGSSKVGWGYFRDAVIKTMIDVARQKRAAQAKGQF